jgi:YjjG family noncanonical pyrimidine nucleotidase
MRYSTFLLDLDHTLFDTDASEIAAFEETMAAAGVQDSHRYLSPYQEINLELWAAVERGEISPNVIRAGRFERLVAEQGLDADPLQMADDFVAGLGAHGELYQGVHEVLQHLSENASLAMVTNGLGEVQRTRIDRLGIGGYFDAVAISAEVGASKPGVEIFDFVFQSLGSPSKESAVMVGDNLSADIRGGVNYGIATCWYNPHGRPPNGTDHSDHEIEDLEELGRLLAA